MKKYRYMGPTFKLWWGSGVSTFKVYEGSRIPLLNFEGDSGPRVPRSQFPLRKSLMKLSFKDLFSKYVPHLLKIFNPF